MDNGALRQHTCLLLQRDDAHPQMAAIRHHRRVWVVHHLVLAPLRRPHAQAQVQTGGKGRGEACSGQDRSCS